jgi:hypothetical protein
VPAGLALQLGAGEGAVEADLAREELSIGVRKNNSTAYTDSPYIMVRL